MFPTTFILFVISVLIINSSIKLAIYSNRWTIKTMQLVEELNQDSKIKFIWKYEEDDEDIQKLGEEFNKLTKSPMDLISIDV